MARDRDEGIPTIGTEGADASGITTDPEGKVTMFTAVDSLPLAACCAKIRWKERSVEHVQLAFLIFMSSLGFLWN